MASNPAGWCIVPQEEYNEYLEFTKAKKRSALTAVDTNNTEPTKRRVQFDAFTPSPVFGSESEYFSPKPFYNPYSERYLHIDTRGGNSIMRTRSTAKEALKSNEHTEKIATQAPVWSLCSNTSLSLNVFELPNPMPLHH